jgi:hypothetical protein
MREFTTSPLSLPWAVSLLSVEQLANIIFPQGSGKATVSFDALTQVAGEQLSETTQSLFLLGDNLQREATDLVFSLLTPDVFKPCSGATSAIVQQSAEIFRSLNPVQDGTLTLQELQNKLEVFFLVRNIPNTLQLPIEPPFPPLLEVIQKAYAMEPYAALWAVEGIGHWYGDTVFARRGEPQNLLAEASVRDLPRESLTMFHAGIGMSMAQHWVKTVNHRSPIANIRYALARAIALCREHSLSGYEGAALESLGLITRNGQFYSETRPDAMVQIVSRELERLDPDVFEYFWHGVGRAHYFLPVHFIPGYGSIWHAVRMIQQAVPNDRAWLNAIAGLAWGVTMVNIRHPQIVANFLRYHGAQLSTDDGFANGVVSSLMMRYDTTPHASFIVPYVQYQPGSADPQLARLWQSQVQQPCTVALAEYYPVLQSQHRLGDIFRYQVLPAVVAQMG